MVLNSYCRHQARRLFEQSIVRSLKPSFKRIPSCLLTYRRPYAVKSYFNDLPPGKDLPPGPYSTPVGFHCDTMANILCAETKLHMAKIGCVGAWAFLVLGFAIDSFGLQAWAIYVAFLFVNIYWSSRQKAKSSLASYASVYGDKGVAELFKLVNEARREWS